MAMKACGAVTLILAVVIHCASASGWNYDVNDDKNGPGKWGNVSALCDDDKQSPIDIVTNDVVSTPNVKLELTGYDKKPSTNYKLANNGHSVVVQLDVTTVSLKKTELAGKYVLEQFHFHWGPDNTVGSEHSIDGKFYPLEIHFVHYNSEKHGDVSEAVNATGDSSALLALGVMVDVKTDNKTSPRAERVLTAIIDKFENIKYKYNSTEIDSFEIGDLFPSDTSKVYTYSGGLTTPPCVESVNWNVFREPIYLPADKILKFRQLYAEDDSHKITVSYRPIQPLNNRKVNSYEYKPNNGTGKTRRDPVTTLFGAVALTVFCRVFSCLQ